MRSFGAALGLALAFDRGRVVVFVATTFFLTELELVLRKDEEVDVDGRIRAVLPEEEKDVAVLKLARLGQLADGDLGNKITGTDTRAQLYLNVEGRDQILRKRFYVVSLQIQRGSHTIAVSTSERDIALSN